MEILGCIGLLVLVALVLSIPSLIIMWLWNWLMPTLFGLPVIGFWQALGLSILVGMLTGGIKIQTKD